ncbi:hypothetical protein ACS0PU_000961 [Formica fusca]
MQERLLRMIWGQLGPALKPLIPFGNLSVPGIDLRPTRGSKVRRMAPCRAREEVTCQLSYPTIHRKIMYGGHDTWHDKSRPVSQMLFDLMIIIHACSIMYVSWCSSNAIQYAIARWPFNRVV